MSSIFEFAKNGDFDGVKNLIENGTDVNIQDEYGQTPLHLASESSYLDVVKFLIENGADVNITNNNGTPLHNACENGHLDIVKFLIENGADINIKDKEGKKPLDYIECNEENFDIIKFIIENNPNNKYEIIKPFLDNPLSSEFTEKLLAI